MFHMSVCLLSRDYQTNYCKFSFDSWSEDGSKLPNMTTRGKEGLSNILSCCQGSQAIGTDGTNFVLTGQNIWVKYNGNSGSGSSGGGSSDSDSDDGFIEL